MKKNNKKKIVNTAALGVSLLLSSTLLVGNAVSVYASPTISTDEQNAIDAFLATQPTDGATRNIGTTNPTVTPSTYTFPGANNYVSAFCIRDQKVSMDQDYTYALFTANQNYGTNVKLKDWNTVEFYRVYNTQSYIDLNGGENEVYYTRKATFINLTDNSEIVVNNVILNKDGYTVNDGFPTSRYYIDIPIEKEDPRFQINCFENNGDWLATEYSYYPTYWKFVVPSVSVEFSYDTIVEIDESLKMNETVIDINGMHGKKEATFTGEYSAFKTTSNDALNETIIRGATSDVIYNKLKTQVRNASNDGSTISVDEDWGSASGTVSITESQNRVIRVGIDYTHYVTEDGTVLKPKTYGLNGVETITGYEHVTTRREANGDRVHVYKVATSPVTPGTPVTPITPVTPTTPTTPTVPVTPAVSSQKGTPKTGDINVFTSAFMLFTGMIGSVGIFITKKKNSK